MQGTGIIARVSGPILREDAYSLPPCKFPRHGKVVARCDPKLAGKEVMTQNGAQLGYVKYATGMQYALIYHIMKESGKETVGAYRFE